jgi:hypothetical protein
MKRLATILLLIATVSLVGCANVPSGEYVAADRANYEATAPLIEYLLDNALLPANATSLLPDAIENALDLLGQADDTEDVMGANSLRLQAVQVLRDATTGPAFGEAERQIWRDGMAAWLARIEAAEEGDE